MANKRKRPGKAKPKSKAKATAPAKAPRGYLASRLALSSLTIPAGKPGKAKAKRKAQAPAKRKAQAPAKRKAQAPAKRKAQAPAKRKAQAPAKRKAQAPAKRKAQAPAERKAQAKTKGKAKARGLGAVGKALRQVRAELEELRRERRKAGKLPPRELEQLTAELERLRGQVQVYREKEAAPAPPAGPEALEGPPAKPIEATESSLEVLRSPVSYPVEGWWDRYGREERPLTKEGAPRPGRPTLFEQLRGELGTFTDQQRRGLYLRLVTRQTGAGGILFAVPTDSTDAIVSLRGYMFAAGIRNTPGDPKAPPVEEVDVEWLWSPDEAGA